MENKENDGLYRCVRHNQTNCINCYVSYAEDLEQLISFSFLAQVDVRKCSADDIKKLIENIKRLTIAIRRWMKNRRPDLLYEPQFKNDEDCQKFAEDCMKNNTVKPLFDLGEAHGYNHAINSWSKNMGIE